jgi:hypothetical protein
MNFLPTLEIALLKSDEKTVDQLKTEAFADAIVFEDDENSRFPKIIPEKLNRYIKFYTSF